MLLCLILCKSYNQIMQCVTGSDIYFYVCNEWGAYAMWTVSFILRCFTCQFSNENKNGNLHVMFSSRSVSCVISLSHFFCLSLSLFLFLYHLFFVTVEAVLTTRRYKTRGLLGMQGESQGRSVSNVVNAKHGDCTFHESDKAQISSNGKQSVPLQWASKRKLSQLLALY